MSVKLHKYKSLSFSGRELFDDEVQTLKEIILVEGFMVD